MLPSHSAHDDINCTLLVDLFPVKKKVRNEHMSGIFVNIHVHLSANMPVLHKYESLSFES